MTAAIPPDLLAKAQAALAEMQSGPIVDVSPERSERIIARTLLEEREAFAALAKSLRNVGPNLAPAMADYIADAILAGKRAADLAAGSVVHGNPLTPEARSYAEGVARQVFGPARVEALAAAERAEPRGYGPQPDPSDDRVLGPWLPWEGGPNAWSRRTASDLAGATVELTHLGYNWAVWGRMTRRADHQDTVKDLEEARRAADEHLTAAGWLVEPETAPPSTQALVDEAAKKVAPDEAVTRLVGTCIAWDGTGDRAGRCMQHVCEVLASYGYLEFDRSGSGRLILGPRLRGPQ